MRRAFVAILLLATLTAAARADMLTYENERFGTRASFSVDLFSVIDPPPANGDGRRFRSLDGAELAIYGQFNALDWTPASMVEDAKNGAASRGREITYSASGKDWAVISGRQGGKIFYERHEFRGDVIHSIDLSYPELASAVYDRLAGEIAKSLDGP